MQTKKRYTVTITELGERRHEHAARVFATDDRDARDRAIIKLFGWHTFRQADSGLGASYGQVFEALPNTGNGFSATSRTRRARVNVERGW